MNLLRAMEDDYDKPAHENLSYRPAGPGYARPEDDSGRYR